MQCDTDMCLRCKAIFFCWNANAPQLQQIRREKTFLRDTGETDICIVSVLNKRLSRVKLCKIQFHDTMTETFPVDTLSPDILWS